MWGVISSENQGRDLTWARSRLIFRGAFLARSKLNTVKRLSQDDIDVQISGAEAMVLRQYRHTWVSGMTDLASFAG